MLFDHEIVHLIGDFSFTESDEYYVIYPNFSISRSKRKTLKEKGLKLKRDSETNEEIWIYPKSCPTDCGTDCTKVG